MEYQKYQPTIWKDEPDEETSLDKDNLNHLECGIKNLENLILKLIDPIGVVTAYAGKIAPDGYLLCDGKQYSRTEYAELFAVIGTAFNLDSDTDSTKFRVPNKIGKVTVGAGKVDAEHNFLLGKTGGEYEHQLTVAELPKHKMTFGISPNSANGGSYGLDGSSSIKMESDIIGNDQAHNNMPPYLVLNYIIRAK